MSAFGFVFQRKTKRAATRRKSTKARREQVYANWAESNEALRPEPESPAGGEALGRQVQAALMKLPARQRAAIVLTVYDGHNHAEAAQILGCSETTVSWRVFAARRKLKRLLQAAEGRNE